MRYYISDCHFYHNALLAHMDKRGFESVEKMNEAMIEAWNSRVRKNDEVVILGDFSWGTTEQTEEILKQLKGKKFLIRGNHDLFLEDKKFDASKYFGWVKDYAELSDNKRKVVLSHYPIACYNGQYRRNEQGVPTAFMLHGHIHSTQDQDFMDAWCDFLSRQKHLSLHTHEMEGVPCQIINCFCQYSNYVPQTLDEWIEIDKNRRAKKTVPSLVEKKKKASRKRKPQRKQAAKLPPVKKSRPVLKPARKKVKASGPIE